jgi:hypothetical protein
MQNGDPRIAVFLSVDVSDQVQHGERDPIG